MPLEISSDFFTFYGRKKSWITELSDLQGELARQGVTDLDMQDSKRCFWMVSSKTGLKMLFKEYRRHLNADEDELLSIEFRCDDLLAYRVIMFND